MAGKITALEPQKHSSRRVNVYLDGEFAFGLALSVAEQVQLGQHLTAEDCAALQAADALERAHENALGYLSYRPRSEAEVRRHLVGKGFTEETAETVLQRLGAVGLVDDPAFARYWVENRAQFRPRGHRGLSYELRQRGISPAVIEMALEDFDEGLAARQVAAAQARRLAHLPPEEFRKRLAQRLARRGFPYPLIQELLADTPFPDPNSDESKEI